MKISICTFASWKQRPSVQSRTRPSPGRRTTHRPTTVTMASSLAMASASNARYVRQFWSVAAFGAPRKRVRMVFGISRGASFLCRDATPEGFLGDCLPVSTRPRGVRFCTHQRCARGRTRVGHGCDAFDRHDANTRRWYTRRRRRAYRANNISAPTLHLLPRMCQVSRDGGASLDKERFKRACIAVETTHARSPAAWCGCVSPTNTIACVLSEQHDTSVAGEPDTAPRRDVGRFDAKRKRLFWQFLFAFLVSANLAPTSSLRTHSCVLVGTETDPVLPPLPFQSTPTA